MSEKVNAPSSRIELFEKFRLIAVSENMSSDKTDRLLALAANAVPPSAFEWTTTELGYVSLIGTYNDPESEKIAYDCLDDLSECHRLLPISHDVTLFISSGGGYVELGLAIQAAIEQMRREGRRVVAHVTGYAMSSSFDIVQHCDYRKAEPTAGFMVHEEQSDPGDSSSSRLLAEGRFSKKMEDTQFALYSRRTGQSVKYYKDKTQSREWYLTAPEALAEGFIDEIVPCLPFAQPKLLQPIPRRKKAAKVVSDG
jgi:ATP-dependent protease ClpP protease subunit